ncbi:non-homologous end-joining DNA ligase [Nocardioides jejuensis]|uniref:ATP-dependent DNA ligase n=1 Tax=Nocardioides jejuensis TaxID=2502782 RepID=A0A4R1CGD1_9ACTN|nr:non-homologous end-joining DNA ligase [Nocardioides jejuensis]TCJ29971.1 ATP-dependent DNA ligase [Nocardioides jejuensis]
MSPAGTEVVTEVDGHRLTLSNLAKVLYPATGTTKGEILDYYVRIAPVLLPHIADRAVTRIRWPHGVAKQSFFEKNAPAGAPSWLKTVSVPTTGSRSASGESGELRFPVVDGLAALVYLVNLASLELHVHQWKVSLEGVPSNPDRLVVDLDPGDGAGLMQCCEVALLARSLLASRDLEAKPVTSGSKGLHLYVPLDGSLSADESTALAKDLAEELQAAHPTLVTATMTKARRAGKVFFDWSQNSGSKTTVAPYSLRGKERPTVATPLTWAEVEEGANDELGLDQFTYAEVLARVADLGDLFA